MTNRKPTSTHTPYKTLVRQLGQFSKATDRTNPPNRPNYWQTQKLHLFIHFPKYWPVNSVNSPGQPTDLTLQTRRIIGKLKNSTYSYIFQTITRSPPSILHNT